MALEAEREGKSLFTHSSGRAFGTPLNSGVEAVEKPLSHQLTTNDGKNDLTDRSTINAQHTGRGSSTS
jgi:hypothetical protein